MGIVTHTGTGRYAAAVRQRIERGGEHLWRFQDFSDLPSSAVAQTLSRLARSGSITRLSKGIYYRSRQTAFGPSRPNPAALLRLAAHQTPVFPAGTSAANLLGFTTQNPKRREIATTALSLPRRLVGRDTVIHAGRPAAWEGLSDIDAALLDFLRFRGMNSELSPEETVQRTLTLMAGPGRFKRLCAVAAAEPPRVRAMLGAIGQQMGVRSTLLQPLRASLNPLTRFDFGRLSGLACAGDWQAKGQRGHAAIRASGFRAGDPARK